MQEIPAPIQWHEGMLLMPQHFQQMAGRYECLIQYVIRASGPFPWGVTHFEYDRTSLSGGNLRISRIECVMPDGFFVKAGADSGFPLELNLKNHTDQIQSGFLPIHLVIPAQQSMSTRGELARYESHDGGAVADETTGEEPVYIPRLRVRVGLWPGERPPARFESLALMRIQVNGDVFQNSDYIPPAMTVSPDSVLGAQCSEVLSFVRTKSYLLADCIRTEPVVTGDDGTSELRAKVQGLAVGLPAPEAAVQSGSIHPFALYLMMCQLAGHVSTITSARVCPQFPPYHHHDLLGTFRPVLEHIRAAVAEAVVESWIALPFRNLTGSFEAGPSADLDRIISAGNTGDHAVALALRVPLQATEDMVRRWCEDSVIGSSGLIASLLANRVPGAARRPTERLPGLLPPRGTILVALTVDGESARVGEALQIMERSSDGRPTDAILYIQRPREGASA